MHTHHRRLRSVSVWGRGRRTQRVHIIPDAVDARRGHHGRLEVAHLGHRPPPKGLDAGALADGGEEVLYLVGSFGPWWLVIRGGLCPNTAGDGKLAMADSKVLHVGLTLVPACHRPWYEEFL